MKATDARNVVCQFETLEPRTLLSSTGPTASLVVENAIASEADMTAGVIRINLDHAAGVPLTVKLSISGSAKRNHEYTIDSKTVLFGPDDTTATVLINPLDDARGLGDRTVVVKIAGSRAYNRGEAYRGVVTIDDKEPKVTVTALDRLATETTVGTASDAGLFRIVQDGDVPLDVFFKCGGSAKQGTNFLLTFAQTLLDTQKITVPPGPDGIDVNLLPIDDVVYKGKTMSAVLKLISNCGYSLSPDSDERSAKVTITDNDAPVKLKMTSNGFTDGGTISTTKWLTHSPTLAWTNVPEGTKSFAIIMDSPCPVYRPFVHWVIYNIPATTTSLSSDDLPDGTTIGKNTSGLGLNGWTPPVPPPLTKHRYDFRLYALDADLNLPAGLTRAQLLSAINGHVLSSEVISATAGSGIMAVNDPMDLIKDWF